MFNIVIFGAPGSGKGTQSKMIVERYGFDYISTGDMLRQAISQGSELGRTAKEYIDRGQLVPDDLIVRLIADFLDGKHGSKGVIFDGFPRTLKQAEALKTMLNERGTDIHILLDLQVEDDELVDRLIERPIRRQSGDHQGPTRRLSHPDGPTGYLLYRRREARRHQGHRTNRGDFRTHC